MSVTWAPISRFHQRWLTLIVTYSSPAANSSSGKKREFSEIKFTVNQHIGMLRKGERRCTDRSSRRPTEFMSVNSSELLNSRRPDSSERQWRKNGILDHSRFDVVHTRVHVEWSLTGLRDFRTKLSLLFNFEFQSCNSSYTIWNM